MTALPNSLEENISGRTAHVGIVGLGYVGLPTMVALAQAGFKVTGLDIAQERADRINAGDSYVEDVSSHTLGTLVSENKITATTDYAAMADMHVVIICVPTPVNRNKGPVLVPLQEAAHSLASNMRGEQLVVLQSTSFPGTTEELVLPILQGDGRKVNRNKGPVLVPLQEAAHSLGRISTWPSPPSVSTRGTRTTLSTISPKLWVE